MSCSPTCAAGGASPLGLEELVAKYRANTTFGGWSNDRAEAFLQFAQGLFEADDLSGLAAFAG